MPAFGVTTKLSVGVLLAVVVSSAMAGGAMVSVAKAIEKKARMVAPLFETCLRGGALWHEIAGLLAQHCPQLRLGQTQIGKAIFNFAISWAIGGEIANGSRVWKDIRYRCSMAIVDAPSQRVLTA